MEAEYGGRFTDLRLGLFTVEEGMASCLTRGWSLLQWKSSLNFCSKCGQPLGELECSVIPSSHRNCRYRTGHLVILPFRKKDFWGRISKLSALEYCKIRVEVVYHSICLEHIVL